MAVMDALLRIRAQVSGEGGIDRLSASMAGVGRAAGNATGGVRGLISTLGMGGLAGSLGVLAPLLSVAGLIGMTKSAMDAAAAMHDMSQRTGVSVEELGKLKKMATMAGTDVGQVEKALIRLGVNMSAAANTAGNAAEDMQQRMKASLQRNIDNVKNSSDRQVQAVKDGERAQLDAVKDAADKRMEAIDNESDKRFKELNRRYRQEQKLLNDKYNDDASRQQEAADEELRQIEKGIERKYEAQIEAIQEDESRSKESKKSLLNYLKDQQEKELDAVRDRFREEAKIRDRALRDAQEREEQALEDRKDRETAALQKGFDQRREIVEKGSEAQRQAITKAASETEASIKKSAEAQIADLKAQVDAIGSTADAMDELGLSGKGVSKMLAELNLSVTDSAGNMKSRYQMFLDISTAISKIEDPARRTEVAMKLLGKSGAALLPGMKEGGDAIDKLKAKLTGEQAEAAKEYQNSMKKLGGSVGDLGRQIMVILLPALQGITTTMIDFVSKFNELNTASGGLLTTLALIVIAWGPITGAVTGIIGLFSGLIGAITTLATILPGIATVVLVMTSSVTTALSGLLTYIMGTFAPAILAFFSGPAGWTVLAVAAVVAMVVLFREPLGKFFTWLGQMWSDTMKAIGGFVYDVFLKRWVVFYDKNLREPVNATMKWLYEAWSNAGQFIITSLNRAANAIKAPFVVIVDVIRGALRGMLQWLADGVNRVIALINVLISAYNRLPAPDIPTIPDVQVPAFAQGGVVDRPTLALIGEGGEREYIIPESKMGRAAASYMAGARGDAVLSGRAAISITTGPVIQQDGQRWVSMGDLERAMRATEAGVLQRIRTPSARAALGIR